jgi:hypothetical protein
MPPGRASATIIGVVPSGHVSLLQADRWMSVGSLPLRFQRFRKFRRFRRFLFRTATPGTHGTP